MRTIFKLLSLLVAIGSALPSFGQIAIEFVRTEGEAQLYPLIEKGTNTLEAQTNDALYVSEQFPAGPEDIRQIEWVEYTLNQLKLFKDGLPLEVVYIIPISNNEVTVVCRRGLRLGYLRLMELSSEAS